MMRRWAVVVGCGFLSACGGGGSVSLTDLVTAIVSIDCESRARCNQMPSRQVCEQSTHLDTAQIKAEVASGKVRYDGVAAKDCLDGLGGISCSLTDNSSRQAPAACDHVFQGTVAEGGACFSGTECASHQCLIAACDATVTCCAGKCGAAVAVVPIGGACGATVPANCVEGAFCQFVGLKGTCVAKLAAGQPCTGFGNCAGGLWCYAKQPGAAMTCARLPARGEACDEATAPCDSSSDVCGPDGTCVARVAPGGACQVNADCYVYARCDATTKKCVTRGALGASCASSDDCLDGLECPVDTCATRPDEPVCS